MLQNTFFQALKFVSFAASNGDVREYLNGVRVELTGETARFIATDGHRLHLAEVEHASEPASFTIPNNDVKVLLRAFKASKDTRAHAVEISVGQSVTFDTTFTRYVAGTLDDYFPDWQRMIRDQHGSTERVAFNPVYVEQAAKAARALDCDCMKWYFYDEHAPAVIHCPTKNRDFVEAPKIVIMPMRF